MTNRTFMTVEEVAAELGVSKSYAYKIVKQLNDELQNSKISLGFINPDYAKEGTELGMIWGISGIRRKV